MTEVSEIEILRERLAIQEAAALVREAKDRDLQNHKVLVGELRAELHRAQEQIEALNQKLDVEAKDRKKRADALSTVSNLKQKVAEREEACRKLKEENDTLILDAESLRKQIANMEKEMKTAKDEAETARTASRTKSTLLENMVSCNESAASAIASVAAHHVRLGTMLEKEVCQADGAVCRALSMLRKPAGLEIAHEVCPARPPFPKAMHSCAPRVCAQELTNFRREALRMKVQEPADLRRTRAIFDLFPEIQRTFFDPHTSGLVIAEAELACAIVNGNITESAARRVLREIDAIRTGIENYKSASFNNVVGNIKTNDAPQ